MLRNIYNVLTKPRIGLIRIDGEINYHQTHQIELSMKRIPSSVKALFVVVNSGGGSPIQSQIIMDKIKNFVKKKKVSCYTFAENMAASGGYLILSCGKNEVGTWSFEMMERRFV